MLVTFSLRAATRYSEEARVYVSTCPRFGVFAQGETEQEAIRAITSTMALYFETAFHYQLFQGIVEKAGFARLAAGLSPAKGGEYVALVEEQSPKYEKIVDITVPVHLLAQQEQIRACPL